MKYKEFRMLIFSIIFFFVIGGVCVYFALDHNRSKVIIGVILSFVVLMMLTTKYNMKIFNDSMLVYEFKGIGILPALIDYKDVKEIKLVSKHKVKIKHKGISTLYILDAESFYEEVMENIEEYKKSAFILSINKFLEKSLLQQLFQIRQCLHLLQDHIQDRIFQPQLLNDRECLS